MIEESNKASWLVLVSALVLHLLLVSLPGAPAGTGFARSLIMDALTPLQRLVDGSVHAAASVWESYFALRGAHEENLRLEAEIDRLRMEVQQNREAVLENDRLRRLLSLDPPVEAPVVARVTGADPTISQRTVTLNKGRSAGIEPGSPVRTPDGIIGRVIHASLYSSIVQLVTDPVSAVGALVQESRVQGIVRGDGGTLLLFEHSAGGAELRAGQVLVTSGADRVYPGGLPIGVISSVGTETDLVSTAVVRPLASLGRIEEVLVLARGLP